VQLRRRPSGRLIEVDHIAALGHIFSLIAVSLQRNVTTFR